MLFFNKSKKKDNKETQENVNINSRKTESNCTNLYITEQLNDSEGETTLLSEQLDENEGETTLLSEHLDESENETTLLSEEITENDSEEYEEDEEEYEGQTSLLSEELSPYLHPEQYGYSNNEEVIDQMNSDIYEDEEDEEGATTLLSSENDFGTKGIYLPDSAPKAYLIKIIKSEKTYINKIKFIIGSSRNDVDCLIDNASVSRKHAFIIYSDGDYYLMDNKSTNKTLLDGEMLEPLKSVKLYHGALIQFSDELFQFVCN